MPELYMKKFIIYIDQISVVRKALTVCSSIFKRKVFMVRAFENAHSIQIINGCHLT